MIKKLSVKNFKSIKELEIDCSGVNLFIGDPNTGKSNILETLGLLSWCRYGNNDVSLKEYIRFEHMRNLFYDNGRDRMLGVYIRDTEIKESAEIGASVEFRDGQFRLVTYLDGGETGGINLDNYGKFLDSGFQINAYSAPIKFYRFEAQDRYTDRDSSFLMPPYGSNLLAMLLANNKLAESVAAHFEDFGYGLYTRPRFQAVEFRKLTEDENLFVVRFPYVLASETMQKAIFYTVAIESNENSTLVFDNLGSGMAPEYVSYLGEKIAFDDKNQYFIATHNPYLFLSILEKTKIDDLNVFITYTRDYQTQVKRLSGEEISEIMVYDPFANMDKFIDSEEVL